LKDGQKAFSLVVKQTKFSAGVSSFTNYLSFDFKFGFLAEIFALSILE